MERPQTRLSTKVHKPFYVAGFRTHQLHSINCQLPEKQREKNPYGKISFGWLSDPTHTRPDFERLRYRRGRCQFDKRVGKMLVIRVLSRLLR